MLYFFSFNIMYARDCVSTTDAWNYFILHIFIKQLLIQYFGQRPLSRKNHMKL